MAKKKKEEVVEKTANEPKGDVTKVQEKMKMKPIVEEQVVTKVDLSKPPTPKENEEIKEDTVDDGGVVELVEDASTPQKQEEIQPETEAQETPVVEEITEEVEELVTQAEEAITESIEKGTELPENIQKLMQFMEDTGGDLKDYIKLSQDYSELDNQSLLKEYYKQTKPHLNSEEIDFMMEDTFSYDEDMDDERDIKRKKLALKEQVANAKTQLEENKSKYYEDIKYGSKLTSEQQKAIDFFNRYNKESKGQQEVAKKQHDTFLNKTNQLFNEKFKGFEYEVGDKKFRFNVKDPVQLKETQGDINNFIKKFLTKDNTMEDAAGYHKGLFTAMNPDAVANHFYEQGKADALKESIAKSKNVNMDPRQAYSENVNTSGLKVRALNNNEPDFKFKIKNKNK